MSAFKKYFYVILTVVCFVALGILIPTKVKIIKEWFNQHSKPNITTITKHENPESSPKQPSNNTPKLPTTPEKDLEGQNFSTLDSNSPVLADTNRADWKVRYRAKILEKIPGTQIHEKSGFWKVEVPQGFELETYSNWLIRWYAEFQPQFKVVGKNKNNLNYPLAFSFSSPQDTLVIWLRKNQAIHPKAYSLAIAFVLEDSLLAEDIAFINQNPLLKSFIVRDWKCSPQTSSFFNDVSMDELWLSLPMEPHQYPYLNPGKDAIYIDHTDEQVEKNINNRLELFPRTRGFATFMGDRVVENELFVTQLLKIFQKKNLYFLDLTESQRSQSKKIGRKLNVFTLTNKYPVPQPDLIAEYTSKILQSQKVGQAIWMVPYNRNNFQQILKLMEQEPLTRLGINLVSLGELGDRIKWLN